MNEVSKSQHIAELARELLDDIELSRTSAESLLLKATRLARWVGSEEIRQWLRFEMRGYNASNESSRKYMGITGRWINKEKNYGYWGPLAQQEAAIDAEKAKLASMRTPDSSSDYAVSAIASVTKAMQETTNAISRLSGIRSRVLANLHEFVSEQYYERLFGGLAESIFERHKGDVDKMLTGSCADVLERIPTVTDRLADGDAESVSQALTTCRRILESFADAVFPPMDEPHVRDDGTIVDLGANRHKNRINEYISKHTTSSSRKTRLRQNLSNLFDRVSTGVHGDVSADEARALFLNTYLFLGEVLHLSHHSES